MKDEIFYRDLEIDERAIDIENRKIDLSFSSEITLQRWFGIEILSHRDGAIDMSRLHSMLFGHNKERIVGPVSKKRLENGNGRAIGSFDETDEGNLAMIRVKSGSLRGVSVGYMYLDKKVRKLAEGEEYQLSTRTIKGTRDDNPTYIIERWAPIEISLTPTPADNSVGVGRDMTRSLETELGLETETTNKTNHPEKDERTNQGGENQMDEKEREKELQAKIEAAVNGSRENSKADMKHVFERASAMGDKGLAIAFRMLTEGKTADDITDELFREIQKERGKPGDGGDGTQDNPKARKFEEVTDDDFARALLSPTLMTF